jgi:predicted amidohydrolase
LALLKAKSQATSPKMPQKSAAKQARLVLFPEGALSGYAKAHILHPDQFDHAAIGDQIKRIGDVARQNNIWAVIGACHQIEGTDRPYNCQYIISDKGELVARNDKIYISHTELQDWYTPGEPDPKTIDIDGFKFGFAICIEATMPQHFQQLEEMGVDCILYSSMANTSLFETLLRGHAAAFTYWVAVSEPVQPDQELCSMLIDPNGQVEHKATTDGHQDLIIATLDRADPRYDIQLRLAKPWRRKARKGDIYKDKRRGHK